MKHEKNDNENTTGTPSSQPKTYLPMNVLLDPDSVRATALESR